jgi:phosphatidylserine/phosphatidylglycerophosphate/cardiolipin synthase-like enzyme
MREMSAGPFADASAATLRALATALRNGQLGPAITRMTLSRVAHCADSIASELCRLSAEGLAPKHMALLLEIAADAAERRLAGGVPASLVWTGPEFAGSQSRDTGIVVEELFAHAERFVLVSSYVVQRGTTVLRTLAARMIERPGLHVQLFLHIGREWRDTRDESELLREFSAALSTHWSGTRRPEVFYDPRTLSADDTVRAAWHAKCVIADEDLAFVTSANFTEWAQQRNVEAGVLIRDRHFASQLRQQFDGLVQSRQVHRLPGF